MRNVKDTVAEIRSLVTEAEFLIARLQACLAVELERQIGNDDDEILSDVTLDDSSSSVSSSTPNPVQRRREELERQRQTARIRAHCWYKEEKKRKEREQQRRW